MASPVIYTPITRAQLGWFTHQNKKCGEQEMDYYRCASRVGQVRAMVDCVQEYEDFNECVFHNKQVFKKKQTSVSSLFDVYNILL